MGIFDFEITHRFANIQITDFEYNSLLEILAWKKKPDFPFPGRTAWHSFKTKPFLSNSPDIVFHAAKVKGVGLWNPPNYNDYSGIHSSDFSYDPQPPNLKEYEYTSQISHIGFKSNGEYFLAYSEPAPFGGVKHDRAVNEYNNAYKLSTSKVPTIFPFLVAAYNNFIYKGERLGVVISLSPEPSPCRLHHILYGKGNSFYKKYYNNVFRSIGIKKKLLDNEDSQLIAINFFSKQIGKLLHDYSLAGLYRHSGGWDNFHYCIDSKQVFLTDLDSSRDIHELNNNIRSLYVLRDFVSVLFKFFIRLYHPLALDIYSLMGLLNYDPISVMIASYFPVASNKYVSKASKILWSYFAPSFYKFKHNKSQTEFDKIEKDFFFVLAITVLFPLFIDSELCEVYPCNYSYSDMLDRAKLFLGNRFEYISFLLSQ